jgi:hypothetical protein
VCAKLRTLYFRDDPWHVCEQKVAQKFTRLKQIMRKFYTKMTEKELMIELNKYSDQDIYDVFNDNGDASVPKTTATTGQGYERGR